MAHMRPQDVPRSPPGDIREACVFLAPRGGLAGLTQNQEWCVLHRFYKQNEIACILCFSVLGRLAGALRQGCFVSCFKTPTRIKIRSVEVIFLALVNVGSEIAFRRRSDLQVAQRDFFQNRRNSANINENQLNCQVSDFL